MGTHISTKCPSPPQVEIREYLERLLAGPVLNTSSRRSRLLRYLVERTLAGEGDQINEYAIGVDVLQKPESFDTRVDSSVRAEMSRLRRALSDYYNGTGRVDPWRIEFPQRGYTPVFLPASCGTPAVSKRPAQAVVRRLLLPLALAFLLGVGGSVLWRFRSGPPPVHSVAVLPFVNMTGDAGQDYIADGITEGLTDSLARLTDLRVVARTSAFQFKGKSVDVRQIGRKLDVEVVVEGSLRKVDGHLLVTVQVNRSRDGFHVLSRAFEGDMKDLGRLENDLGQPVLAAVRPAAPLASRRVPNGEARDWFLKAGAIRGQGTREAFEQAVTYLNRAIQSDPSYADAYAALSGVYANAAINFTSEPLQYVPSAKAAATKALELDPDNTRAYAALGYLDGMVLLDWKRAEQELRKGLPSSTQWLGITLLVQGRFDEALSLLRVVESDDPLLPAGGAMVGQAFYFARRYDEALRQLEKVRQLFPDVWAVHQLLGAVYEAKGKYDKAMAEYRLVQSKSSAVEANIAHLLAVSGKQAEARKILNRLEHPPPARPAPVAFSMALVHAALGDRDRAFEWLERAFEARGISLLKIHPMLDPLRSDPRYAVLLKKSGLSE